MALHGTVFIIGLVLFAVLLPLAAKYAGPKHAGQGTRHPFEFTRTHA